MDSASRRRESAGTPLRQQRSDRWHKRDRYSHGRRLRRLVSRFIFGDGVGLSLTLIVIEYALNAGITPTCREPILLGHGFFRVDSLRRRRNALRALSPKSYAVITNTEPAKLSGT